MKILYKEIKDKQYKDHDPEIIAWQREQKEDLNTALMYSFPQPGDNIKNKRYFAVKDYERVLFYNKGELVGDLGGGIYEIDKKARVKGTEIVWIDISLLSIPWGIPIKNGIPSKDGYMVGLHGDLKLAIQNRTAFYNNLVAGKKEWVIQDLKDWIMSLLHTSLRDIFKNYFVKQIILEERERVTNLVIVKVTEEFISYGLELRTFSIIGLKKTDEIQELLNGNKEKTKTIRKVYKSELENHFNQKTDLQNRIRELNKKKNELQNSLLNGKISQKEYEKKREQIENFIKEAQEELKKNYEALSKI